ncbi:MAG: hypothetical protein K2Z81_06875 [Cyanobacteria bacterium]|nr:hypothetical protein [Cyanobacteriota bacterium]
MFRNLEEAISAKSSKFQSELRPRPIALHRAFDQPGMRKRSAKIEHIIVFRNPEEALSGEKQ